MNSFQSKEIRKAIRAGRHGGSVDLLLKALKDSEITIKVIDVPSNSKYTKKPRVCPRLLGRKPHVNKKSTRPSIFETNRSIIIELGYKPILSHAKKQRVKVKEMRAWNKSGRGSNNEFTVKQRRLMKNRERRENYKLKYVA